MLNIIAIIAKWSGAHSVVEFECLLHLFLITFQEMPAHDLLSLDTNAACLFCYTAFKILDISESGDNRFFLCQKLLDSPATCLVQVPNLYSGEKNLSSGLLSSLC